MQETNRLAALEAALVELDRKQAETAGRLKATEEAFRRWRRGAILAGALCCVVLPQLTPSSLSAADLSAATRKRFKVIETALFGVSPVPIGATDRITTELAAETTARTKAINAVNASVTTEITERTAADTTLTNNLTSEAAARTDGDTVIHGTIDPFFNRVSVTDGVGANTEIVVNGANLHLQNGLGATSGDPANLLGTGVVNGLGNLIVGYNELASAFGVADLPRTGSHNLVLGPGHTYTSWGGAVFGGVNTISGRASSVTGGVLNLASGNASAIHGGFQNTASGVQSSILGGANKTVDTGNGTSP